MIEVYLPWPARVLNPNVKVHWSVKSKAAASNKLGAWVLTKTALRRSAWPHKGARVKVTLFPPDRRRRDLDNALFSCKPTFDGIRDAIGVDDSEWQWDLPEEFSEPVKNGRVAIRVTEPKPKQGAE